MFRREELERMAPLGIFFAVYTLLFLLWRYTFFYSLPFLLGLLVAASLQPVIHFVEKKLGWRHGLACGSVTALALALLFFGGGLLIALAVRELTGFLVRAAQGGFPEFTPGVRNFIQRAGDFIGDLGPQLFEQNWQKLAEFLKSSSGIITAALEGVLEVLCSLPTLLSLLLTAVLTSFFAAKNYDKLRRFIKSFLGPKSIKAVGATRAAGSSGAGQRYFLSYALIYFISFCEAYVISYILGLPYPLITALITCAADVLPVLGPGIVLTPVAIYQLLIGEYGRGLGVMVGWIVMTCIREVIEPKLVASTMKLHPLAMFGAVYCSLAAKSLWVLIYLLGLFSLYGILSQAGLLPKLTRAE